MKNKILKLFFLTLIMFCIGISYSNSSYSYYETSGDYEYTYLEDDAIRITDYYGTAKTLEVPTTIDGLTVTEIGSYAFYNSENLQNVTIPLSVKEIEYNAFGECNNLQNIRILNPYCEINSYAFYKKDYSTDGVKVYGDKDSNVEKYAKENQIQFVVYDTHNNITTKLTKATATTDGKIEKICKHCHNVVESRTLYKASKIGLSATTFTYDGTEKHPYLIVRDSQGHDLSGSDFIVSSYPHGATNAGTYTVTITLANNYSGTVKRTFTIKPKQLKKGNLYILNMTYNGKKRNPSMYNKITWDKMKLNKDYTISKISNNKNVGTAKATIKLKGNFSGTINITYKIIPKKVTGVGFKGRDTSSITIKWKKAKGVSGYKISRWDDKNYKFKTYKTTSATSLKIKKSTSGSHDVYVTIQAYKKVGGKNYYSDEVYYYNCVKPDKMKYSVSCSNIGKIRVIYNNIKNYKNIQIQLCINKSFNDRKYDVRNFYHYKSTYDIYNYSEFYNLASNKNYYVRCREYNQDRNGNPVYGKWGDAKKIYVQ